MRPLLLSTAAALTLMASTAYAAEYTPPSTDLANAPSGSYTLDKNHASLIFSVSHLGFAPYYSRFNSFDATLNFDAKAPEKSSLSVSIDTASADANNPKMEEKYDGDKFFNSKQFPLATFTSTSIKKLTDSTGTITGDLTLRGVTKPVTLDVTFNGAELNPYAGVPTLGFSAKGSFKRSDFGLKAYLPAVGDEVALLISAEFNHQASKATNKNE